MQTVIRKCICKVLEVKFPGHLCDTNMKRGAEVVRLRAPQETPELTMGTLPVHLCQHTQILAASVLYNASLQNQVQDAAIFGVSAK
jgi:hypothetical protein